MFFFDTKPRMSHTSSSSKKEETHGYSATYLCTSHGVSAKVRFSKMCPTLQWTIQDQKLLLLGPIPLHGLCPVIVSREPSRYRSLSSVSPAPSLPYGFSRKGLTQYPRSCQRSPGLAHLCRLCPNPDWSCPTSLCQRFVRSGVRSNRLCFGLHPDRFMPVPFPVGQIPKAKRRDQIAYPFRPARKHPLPYYYYPREDSRCDHSRSNELRTRSVLHLRPRISGFRSPSQDPSSRCLLCDPSQKQFPVQTPLFSTGRQIHWRSMRPDHCPQGVLCQKGLSRQVETNPLFRCHPEQMVCLSNQQLYIARFDHRSALSIPMADRIVLQMDQTASSNQSFLWHKRQCRQNPNLDRYHGLCAGGHRQKTTQTRKESLHNSTDFERQSF